jgi:diphthine synthase
MHTLLLLDIKANENRYMTVNQAIEYLFKVESERREKVFDSNTLCVGIARIGSPEQKILSGTAEQLFLQDFGKPLHCLIVPGNMHFMEEDMLKVFRI